MILVDAIYIHSYGGLSILRALIYGLSKSPYNKANIHFLIDSRVDIKSIKGIGIYKTTKVRPSHFERKQIYLSNLKKYSTIVCLANIPPPLKLDKKVYIYFHNLLLVNWIFELSSNYDMVLNYIKSLYIKFFNKKSYIWITQTEFSKKILSKKLDIEKDSIKVLPFFYTDDIQFKERDFKSKNLNYLCVTSDSKHKNISRLKSAFLKSNFNPEKNINLLITTQGRDLVDQNKKIKYLGMLKREELIKIYSQSHYVIFPSMIESFGLPIIEGIMSGANILSSNIESISEIAKTSLKFNPKNELEIKDTFEKSSIVKYNLSSKLTIQNEINNFIKLINNNV